MKRGIRVTCAVCHRSKCPRGRSAPAMLYLCESGDCKGWPEAPKVGDLWPGETEEDFGYPVTNDGTEEVTE